MKKTFSILIVLAFLILTIYILITQFSSSPSGYAVADSSLLVSYSFEDNYQSNTSKIELEPYGTSFVDGKIGRAVEFDGSEDYLILSEGYFEEAKTLTVAFWVYPISSSFDYQILLWEGREDGNGFGPWDETHITLEKNEKIKFYMKGYGDTLDISANVSQGVWSHVAIVIGDMDIPKGWARIYVDGKSQDYDAVTILMPRNYTHYTRLGMPGKPDHFLNARLDEFKIYNTALSESKILDLYSQGVTCYTDKDCGQVNTTQFCSSSSLCTNSSFPICNNPGKDSTCSMTSNVTCLECEFSCSSSRCQDPPQEEVIEIPALPEVLPSEPSFFRRLKCRIFHLSSKEKRQVCLEKP